MKKCLNNRANHERLDLSHFLKIRLIRQKKVVLKIIPYFASAPCREPSVLFTHSWRGVHMDLSFSHEHCLLTSWGEGLERNDCIPCRRVTPASQKGCLGYESKLKFEFRR